MLMPQVKQVKGINADNADICEEHRDRILEYYCNSHNAIGCLKCKQGVHKNCKDVDLISEVATTFISSEELKELQTNLKELLNCNTGMKNDLNRKTKAVKLQAERAKFQVRTLRKKMDKVFDDFEAKVNREIDTAKSMDEAKLLEIERRVEKLSKDLNDHLLKINDSVTLGKINQLFIKAKLAMTSVKDISAEFANIAMKSNIQRYQFIPEPSIVEMLQNLTEIGKLDIRDSCAKVPKFEKDINIRFPCDANECVITGLEMLSESIMVAVDHSNETVKVVDVENSYLKSVYKINGFGSLIKPFDLVKTDSKQIAVTYPYRRKIHMLEISDIGSIKMKREIDMKNECFGIDRINDNILVSFRKPPSVKILTLTGTVVRTLKGTYTEFPDYVSVNQAEKYIYVSNWASPGPGTVISIIPADDRSVVFEDDKLYGPHGSSVDNSHITCSSYLRTVP